MDRNIPRYYIGGEQVESEQTRFHNALMRSSQELEQLREQVLQELGDAESQIISAHLAMLTDESFIGRVKARIESDLVNVEQALNSEVCGVMCLLSAVENEYIQERAQDVRDVGDRLLKHLGTRTISPKFELPERAVVVADELLPTDALSLDRTRVVAIVTTHGGWNGHAAILARALLIPAVTGIDGIASLLLHHADILVDGNTGRIVVEPTAEEIERFSQGEQAYSTTFSKALADENKECVTRDGVAVSLRANISSPAEAGDVIQHHLQGVGLFRTEMLTMDLSAPPSSENQVEIYQQTAQALMGLPLTIRVFDFGGDKWPLFLQSQQGCNPSMGLRGLRCMFANEELLRAQLEAMLQVSISSRINILFPMVIDGMDFQAALKYVQTAADKVGCSTLPKVGAMIETPSAVYQIRQIAQRADFLSIGTNDLTQFILAADRNAEELVGDYSSLHPAVLTAIRDVVEKAAEYDCPVSICGEAAGNPRMACLFVGLGIRQLSMSPARAASVRHAIRQLDSRKAEEIAKTALLCEATAEVHELTRKLTEDRFD